MDNKSSECEHFLQSAIAVFHAQKKMADAAIGQLADNQLHQPLDENANEIAVIMKHMAGNMISRWTDLLTSDGEKPWRDRDSEFIDDISSRDELMVRWEHGWECLFAALAALGPGDLMKRTMIRGHPHTVIEAIHREMDHHGYHLGQVVQLARFLAKDAWTTLTVPRGGSEAYNRRAWKR
ncbi:MAG: DUF1572 family protein [Phycisphaerae bacterium]|nr:DUF1572 family protein [Phycisphaerae bacterium]